tara:strand:+ start:1815 stop:2864 length:1050 start_codon:yes stop_codon:yes gene_type:complete
MSGGGGGGVQRSTSTVTQSNLPEYARPYFERLMSRGEAQSLEDYIPYTGARIASTPADILASEQLARDVSSAPTPGFDTAYQSFGRQAQGTSPFRSGIAEIFDPSMTMGRYQDPYTANVSRMYDPRQQVGSYMNPYLENVLDVQQRRAQERFDEGQAGRDSQAVSAGAFGGSRRAVADRLARQDLDLRLSDMESQALSSGYSDAMARAEAQQKLQTGLSQQLFSNAQAAAKEQQAMRIAALEKEASLGMDAAQRAATLDPAFQQYGLERVRALAGAGEAARGRDKESLDLAYGDFINQRDFPRQNLQFLGSLLRGVPITASSEVNQYKPSPSPYNALLALGLGAVNPFG